MSVIGHSEEAALIDIRQVGAMLGCSPRHITRLSERGAMPRPIKLGTIKRWNKSAIEKWLNEGCPGYSEKETGASA